MTPDYALHVRHHFQSLASAIFSFFASPFCKNKLLDCFAFDDFVRVWPVNCLKQTSISL